jgi:hypothetical protein
MTELDDTVTRIDEVAGHAQLASLGRDIPAFRKIPEDLYRSQDDPAMRAYIRAIYLAGYCWGMADAGTAQTDRAAWWRRLLWPRLTRAQLRQRIRQLAGARRPRRT